MRLHTLTAARIYRVASARAAPLPRACLGARLVRDARVRSGLPHSLAGSESPVTETGSGAHWAGPAPERRSGFWGHRCPGCAWVCAGRRTGCWRRAWMWRPPSAGRTARSSCRAAVCFGRASSRSSRAAAGGPTAAFAGAGTGPRARLRPRRHRRHRRARRTRAAARPRPPFARRPAGPCASRCAALRAAPAQLPRLPSPPRRAAPLPARPLRPRGRLRRCRASAGCPPRIHSRTSCERSRAWPLSGTMACVYPGCGPTVFAPRIMRVILVALEGSQPNKYGSLYGPRDAPDVPTSAEQLIQNTNPGGRGRAGRSHHHGPRRRGGRR